MSRREKTPFRMEPFRVDDELHRSIRVENREDAASTVPLEEALLLDSAEQRRKLILSVLTDDPVQYYDLLEQARLNDDSEVVHYAATAMAQISKQADAARPGSPPTRRTRRCWRNTPPRWKPPLRWGWRRAGRHSCSASSSNVC